MTDKEANGLAVIYRALGIVEGVAAGASDEEAAVLLQAIEMIEGVLKND